MNLEGLRENNCGGARVGGTRDTKIKGNAIISLLDCLLHYDMS